MTAFGFISVAPVEQGSMAEEVAAAVDAIDELDIWYEVTPMGTLLEAESADELFRAAREAHSAVDSERVSTFLKIDDKRGMDQRSWDKVADMERYR